MSLHCFIELVLRRAVSACFKCIPEVCVWVCVRVCAFFVLVLSCVSSSSRMGRAGAELLWCGGGVSFACCVQNWLCGKCECVRVCLQH